MNIIYKNVDEVLITDATSSLLENCKIYIPIGLSFDIVNLYINNVPLEIIKTTSDKSGYLTYKVLPTKYLNLANGKYQIYIEGINLTNKQSTIFIDSHVNLSFDEYNKLVLSYYSSLLGEDIANTYDKVIKIANLCIDIYNSIKEE